MNNYVRFKKAEEEAAHGEGPITETGQTHRRRPILFLVTAIAVILLISAGIVGTITAIKSKQSSSSTSPETSGNKIRPTKAITEACDQTLYPNLCVNSLVTFPGAMGVTQSNELVHMSVNMTLQRFWHALDLTTEFGGNLKFGKSYINDNNNGGSNSFEKAVYEDCVELLQDSVELLTKSLFTVVPADASDDDDDDATNSSNNQVQGDGCGEEEEDVMTWLSAALANQDTCTESLLESPPGSTLRDQLSEKLKDLSKLVSNCLALYSSKYSSSCTTNSDLAGAPIDNGRRRLLTTTAIDESGFPNWIMSRPEARQLLLGGGMEGGLGVQADVVVAADGTGTVRTIAEAIKMAPEKSNQRFIILLKAGRYEENNLKVGRKKTNLWFVGEGKAKTIITGRKSVRRDKITTFHTATFAATGSGFVAKGITFMNEAGPHNDQAVALRIGSDHAAVYQCQIIGYQDTLYVHSNRQFYRECDVYGTVDFIFGNAAVVFQSCNLFARKPLPMQKNTVTAQKRKDPHDISGISIHKCWFKATSDLEPVKAEYPTFLGRPWKPLSRVVVMLSYIGDHVDPKGWLEWNATSPVNLLYYGEYKNYGPRADVSRRVRWSGLHVNMSQNEAALYTVSRFIYGSAWLMSTGIAFQAGLTD